MKSSVIIKLWLAISALAMGVLLVLGVLVTRQMEGLYDFHLSNHMTEQALGLIELYDPAPHSSERPWKGLETVIGAQITTVTQEELFSLARGMPGSVCLPPNMARDLHAGHTVTFRLSGLDFPVVDAPHGAHEGDESAEAPMAFIAGVPLLQEGVQTGALLLIAPVQSVAQTVSHFRQILAMTAAAMLAAITMVAFYLSNRLSLPLRKMTSMAHSLAEGDFRQRLTVVGKDEVAQLGESINKMADQLQVTIAKLGENNARLSSILASMSDAVIMADLDGQCTLLNPPAVALVRQMGLPAGCAPYTCDTTCLEHLGVILLHRQVAQSTREMARKVPLAGAVFSVLQSPVCDEQGRTQAVVLVCQDVTQEERLEEMRRDFVANVSHEMRTPIALIRGYTEALQDGLAESPAEQADMMNVMREELDRVENLITDLLQLARLDSGQVRFEPEPVALGPLVGYLCRKIGPLMEKASVQVQTDFPPDLPLVLADADRLEQVMLNLTENALRYSPPRSHITISAQVDQSHMTVQVRDQGPGIAPRERHLIWERFHRGDPARSRKKGGTGLGLAIVRGIITAHGGQVWYEDAPGGGSCFCFTLPLSQ